MEHTYDSVGQKKEVIVIEDSESPINGLGKLPRKRTRAVAAQEAAAHGLANGNGINGHKNGTATSSVGVAGKKRKVDDGSDAGSIKKAKAKVSVSSRR